MVEPYNPGNWALGISLNAPMDLKVIKNFGFDCIELVLNGDRFFEDFLSAKQHYLAVVKKAEQLGLKIWSVHLPYGRKWDVSSTHSGERGRIIRFHTELLKLTAEWEVVNAVIHPSYEPISPEDRQGRMAMCRESLKRLAQLSNQLGIQLAVECLPRTCLGNTSEEMKGLLRGIGDIGVCCDVNHLLQEKPEVFIQKLGERIVTLHISDNDGIDERHWMPGEGVINWRHVIHALSNAGYNGPFMFELKNPDPQNIVKCWNGLLDKL